MKGDFENMIIDKEAIFEKHKSQLQLIYFLGGGLMFVSHIHQYLNENETQTWRDLKELEEANLIEINKLHNNCIVKLKQYSLQRILEKDKVQAIAFTKTKILKTAYNNSIILKELSEKCKCTEDFLSNCRMRTNFYYSANQNLYILKRIQFILSKANFDMTDFNFELDKYENKKDKNEFLQLNIDNFFLRNIHVMNMGFSNSDRTKFILKIVFVDLNSSYTPKSLSVKMEHVYNYIILFFKDTEKVDLIFNIYVQDTMRKSRLDSGRPKIDNFLQEQAIYSRFQYQIHSLDITEKLFNNSKILL